VAGPILVALHRGARAVGVLSKHCEGYVKRELWRGFILRFGPSEGLLMREMQCNLCRGLNGIEEAARNRGRESF
jgi:hypothetical protein